MAPRTVAVLTVAARTVAARTTACAYHGLRVPRLHSPRPILCPTRCSARAPCSPRGPISPLYLPYISPIAPLYIPYISPVSPLHLPYISPQTQRSRAVLTAWAEAMAWPENTKAPDDQVLD